MHFTFLNNARMAFKIKCQMVEELQLNFKNKYKKRNNSSDQNGGLICPHCWNGQLFMQKNVLACLEWTKL